MWWALHGWGISNGWRLRRVWEAEQAEADPDWWFYPNGRMYHTPLRKHMKELVDQIIAEAEEEGFVSTRKRSGPTYVPGSTRLDPVVCEHMPEFAETRQRCQQAGCDQLSFSFCPGCRKSAGGAGGAGFYCLGKHRNCFAAHHRKLRRTCVECDEE